MRANITKQILSQGKPAFGFSMGLGSPLVAEILANSGIDFILLDTQHGSWGPDSTILALAAMSGGTATPMARVAANNYTLIGRLLDEGMLGIVVPMVHTPADAKAVADACRLPPRGQRSWGTGRAGVLGADYLQRINDELFVAVQIESAQAVENAEAIMATPGIDGCWVGPSDLALSMGIHPSEMANREEHHRALERVIEACRNTGKAPGFAGFGPEDAVQRYEQGFRFLTCGRDGPFINAGAKQALKIVRTVS